MVLIGDKIKNLKKVLITGARSKLTINLIKYYKKKNYKIALLSKNDLIINDNEIQVYKVDLTNEFKIDFIPDIIIHIAAYDPYNHKNPIEDDEIYRKNVTSCYRILELAVKSKVKHFCLISSVDVYGKSYKESRIKPIITEEDNCLPDNIYGLSKLACEKIAYTFNLLHNLNISILRFGPIVGPNMNKNLTIYKMITGLLDGETVNIKNSESLVSFLSEEDASAAIIKACQKKNKLLIFNITGPYLKIKYLFNGLINSSNKKFKVSFLRNSNDEHLIQFSNKLAKNTLDWIPYHNFDKIIQSFILNKNT